MLPVKFAKRKDNLSLKNKVKACPPPSAFLHGSSVAHDGIFHQQQEDNNAEIETVTATSSLPTIEEVKTDMIASKRGECSGFDKRASCDDDVKETDFDESIVSDRQDGLLIKSTLSSQLTTSAQSRKKLPSIINNLFIDSFKSSFIFALAIGLFFGLIIGILLNNNSHEEHNGNSDNPSVLYNTSSSKPSNHTSNSICDSLVKNGNLEQNTTKPFIAWGSNMSLISPGYNHSKFALKVSGGTYWTRGAYQSWPIKLTNCFHVGQQWLTTAKVRLVDPKTGEGVDCNPTNTSSYDCPMIRHHAYGPSKETDDKTGTSAYTLFRDTNMTWNKNDWNEYRKIITVTKDMVNEYFTMYRPILVGGYDIGADLLIDDFTYTQIYPLPLSGDPSKIAAVATKANMNRPVTNIMPTYNDSFASSRPQATSSPNAEYSTGKECSSIVRNGDFETNNSSPFLPWGANISIISPGYESNFAMRVTGGNYFKRGVYQNWFLSPNSCFQVGQQWLAKAKVRLVDSLTGEGVQCDPRNITSYDCPMIIHDSYGATTKQNIFKEFRDTDMVWDKSKWNTYRKIITITEDIINENFTLYRCIWIGGYNVNADLWIDDFTYTQIL